MRKLFLINLLLIGFSSIYCQEKFIDILKNLSVEDKVVNTTEIAEGSNYFELMQNKQNFQIKEHKLNAWYINSYKSYSIYQLVCPDDYTDEVYKSLIHVIKDYDFKRALLFDHKRQRCYLIKYSDASIYRRCFEIKSIDRYNKISINPRFEDGVRIIVRLDETLKPLFLALLDTYEVRKRNDNKSLILFYEFEQRNKLLYSRLIKPENSIIRVYQMTDDEFAKFFSSEHGYTDHGKTRAHDPEMLFENNEEIY